jgi:hypothetical protein
MENISITPKSDGVTIELKGMGPEKNLFLDTFAECESGACACDSDEYLKVESMQVQDLGDGITIDVRTKAGQEIDTACITDCLTSIEEQAHS